MAIEVPSLRKPEPNIGQRERIITFADGTTAFRSYSPFIMILDGIDFFEKMFFESKASTSNSDNIKGTFYLPIFGHVTLPSFSFGFSWGMPIPHLY